MRLLLLSVFLLQLPAAPQPVPDVEVEPALREVVQRFFTTQEAEDAEGYLALWSAKGSRPTPEQLTYIFDAGDDTFLDVRITRATVIGDIARIRVHATRARTDDRIKKPDGTPRILRTPLQLALAFVRENGSWKLVREGSPVDELAAALIDAPDAAERQALLAAEPDLLHVRLFEAISRQADVLARQTRYRAAQRIYEISLEVAVAAGQRKSEGQAVQNLANARYFQQDFAGALQLYERRLRLERELANDEGIASALVGIGTIQYSTHDYGEALATYRQALEVQERLDDQLLIASTLISTANVLYLQGNFDAAIADYRRAEILKRKFFDLSGAATALEGLGRVYAAQGDYASALGAYGAVLEERRKHNTLAQQAQVLHRIGEIHFRLGNLDQSRETFAESYALFEQVKDLGAAGRVLQGTGLTELATGRFPLAEKAYAESITACTAATDGPCVAGAQVGLAFALSAQRKFEPAAGWYRKAIASFTALAEVEAASRARLGLAEALIGLGDYQAAHDEASTARKDGVALPSDDLLWRALVSQARADRKLGRAEAALGAARAAVLTVRTMAADALDRPTLKVSRDTTSAYAAAVVLQAEAGDAVGAFNTAEAMRAHSLRLWLAPHEREISRGMTDEERAEERRLTFELTTLMVRREREGALKKANPENLARLDEAGRAALESRRSARERVFARLADLQRWRGLAPAPSANDLEAVLGQPAHVLLSFVVDEHDLVVFAASRPVEEVPVQIAAHVVPLERQALGEAIARVMEPPVLGDAARWRRAGAEFFSFLPKPVGAALAAARAITIVPDDLLWRVPFEAMPLNEEYLADRARLSYASSLRTAADTTERHASAAPTLIVAAPELPAATVARLAATAPSWTLRRPEHGTTEARAIAEAYADPPARLISGSDATPSVVKEAMATASAIHIAAPFRINSAAPLFSSILLAEGETGENAPTAEDSWIELRELFGIESRASAVTLTDAAALSMRDAAAAIVPVDWAWRTAGASGLVVRRWGTKDPRQEEGATALMRRFHELIRGGTPAATALQRAAAAVRTDEATRAPAAWAGWLVLGVR